MTVAYSLAVMAVMPVGYTSSICITGQFLAHLMQWPHKQHLYQSVCFSDGDPQPVIHSTTILTHNHSYSFHHNIDPQSQLFIPPQY
jgi:hypothetical protein